MKLYTYWRSSAAYRVRIALNLKQVEYESVFVHLVKDGGEQLKEQYQAINPQQLVPALALENGRILTQSMAIIEYLDETIESTPLLPSDALGRSRVRALSQSVACEIHPVNNLRVLKYLSGELNVDDAQKTAWYRHWVTAGFDALEKMLSDSDETGTYCHGEQPGLADLCLIPQIYNAVRFDVDLAPYPTIQRISQACSELPAFQQAAPERQRDAQ